MDPLVLTVLIAAFSLATLVFVMVLVAARADHQVTIRGPMATLDALERQIATKRETLVDLDDDLNKRREALANIAGIQAEVDALIRQKDELLTEHGQLEDRRKEILALRKETEDAYVRHAEATQQLAETTAEHERLQTELTEARRLVGETDAMTKHHKTLSDKISQLRAQAADLEALLQKEDALRARMPELEREVARLDGELKARRRQREEAEAAAHSAEQKLAELHTELVEAAASLAVAQQNIRQSQDEIKELEKRRDQLQALVTGVEGETADPLAELRSLPPVLVDLRDRGRLGGAGDRNPRIRPHAAAP